MECRTYLYELLRRRGVADFDVLREEYVLDLMFVNTSPLYVGSGRGGDALGSAVDLSIIEGSVYVNGRVYEGPIIPGSSLKGVLRSLSESIAAGLGGREAPWLVFEATLPTSHEEGDSKLYRCTGDGLPDLENWLSTSDCDNAVFRGIVDRYFDSCFASPVVRLFGAPWLSSHVFVYDAYPVDGARPSTNVVTRVAIDRLTGSQRPNMLYTLEAVKAGVKWHARLRIVNIDLASSSREAWLLRMLLALLAREGIHVGGRTSIGHGRLIMVPKESRARRIYLDPERMLITKEVPISSLISA